MNWLLRLAVIAVVLSSVSLASERYTFVPGQGYVVNPKTAPKYLLVSAFYDHSLFNYRAGFGHYEAFLKQLNIKPNTEAEPTITKAILKREVLRIERMDALKPHQNAPEDVWDDMQFDTLKEEVCDVKKIYTTMLKELATQGVLPEVVETFLEKKIRDTTNLTASDPPVRELDAFDVFEKEE